MHSRNWFVASFWLLTVALAPAAASETAPTLVVRVKSLDGLIADAKYLAKLAGQAEQAEQFEKMLPAFLGPKGLAGTGVDTTRPWGLYAILNPQIPNSPVVVLIPVSDEFAFVEFVKTLVGFAPGATVAQQKTQNPGDERFTIISSPAFPVEAYVTIADRYAYITAYRKESISKANRLPAATLLNGDDKTVIGVSARLDIVDPQFKQMALGQFENQVAAVKERKSPSDSPVLTKFKSELVDYVAGQVRSLLTDGQSLEFQIRIDRKTDDISTQLSLSAKPDSPLAKQIAAEGGQTSRFGPLKAAAIQGAVNVAIPQELRESFGTAIEEGFKQEQARQKDAVRKNMAQKIFDVLAPTLKSGAMDVVAGVVGPNADGKYTFASAIKVKDAPRVEQLVRDLVPTIPDPKAKEAVALDAETVDGVKVHKITPYDLDAEGKRLVGEHATGRVAFPTDAMVVAFGADSADVLKQILGSNGRRGGPLRLEGAVSRVIGLDKDNGPRAKEAAAAAFSKPGSDLFRFSVEGGTSLRVRASMKAQVITFGAKMGSGGSNP